MILWCFVFQNIQDKNLIPLEQPVIRTVFTVEVSSNT